MKSCSAAWLCALVAGIHNAVDAFVPRDHVRSSPPLYSQQQETKPCFYRERSTRQWKPRINIVDLYVGQQLNGTVVQELLDGKTGPKLFFDCGVGRINVQGDWEIVNGMMRLGKNAKMSVTKKQATRLRRKDNVEVVVSRVSPQSARFEVIATSIADVHEQPKLIPASLLKPNQELVGTVTRIVPYGVFVDVGANRRGLLHIQKVANLYGRYIDKEQGLEEAGLERGARIRVAVLSNEKKRLFLDFTDDVKQEAEAERPQEETVATQSQQQEPPDCSSEEDSYDISEEEAAAWAAYASTDDESEGESIVNDDDNQDDDYDEERDIEDALGLGTY